MPLYDYHCRACGADFELLVRADTVPACRACGAPDIDRRLSRPAPPGTSAGIVRAARRAASREGHFSHYGGKERPRLA